MQPAKRALPASKSLNNRGYNDLEIRDALSLLEDSNDAVIWVDDKFRYLYVNKQGEVCLGKRQDEVLGKKMLEFYPHARKSLISKKGLEVKKTKRYLEFDDKSIFSDRYFKVKISPVKPGICFYLKDITDQKRSE